MMTISLDNYKKPANKKWKLVSKFLTRTLPIYITILAAIPDDHISITFKIWGGVAMSVIVATISGLSEFTTENN